MNTDERDEREPTPEYIWIIRQHGSLLPRYWTAPQAVYLNGEESFQYVRADLFDSQAATMRELAMIVDVGTSDDPGVALATVRRLEESAATRMREACVAKVREMRDEWQRQHSPVPYEHTSGEQYKVSGANKIIEALESLTLDSTEQREEKDG